MKFNAKKIAICGLLVATAIVLNFVEIALKSPITSVFTLIFYIITQKKNQ